ncbi:MAG: hypothetical protein AB2L18_02255 [Anaerolineaceae bacterium]
MALQVSKRELTPVHIMKPFALIFCKLPVHIVKQEVLEMNFGVIMFLYCMKIYYGFLCWLAPFIQRINPRAFRQIHFRISFYLYKKIIPPSSVLLRTGLRLVQKI